MDWIRVATIPEKVTPTPAKSGSELTPVTPTPPKSRNLVEPNPESDSDSFWGESRLQATPIPGIVATLDWIERFSADEGSRSVRRRGF